MARRTRARRLSGFNHPRTGNFIPVRTPAGTIPAITLVRAFKEARTVLPDGSARFDSKPVQAVLEPYSEELKHAAEIQQKRCEVNWRHWEEHGLKDNGWIQFHRVLQRLIDAFVFTPASS